MVLGCLSNTANLGTFPVQSNAHGLGIDSPPADSCMSVPMRNHPGRETDGRVDTAYSSPDSTQKGNRIPEGESLTGSTKGRPEADDDGPCDLVDSDDEEEVVTPQMMEKARLRQ